MEIVNGNIEYDIEKELGIEIVGDTKVRISVDEEEADDWEEIVDDKEEESIMQDIDNSVNEDFLKEEQ